MLRAVALALLLAFPALAQLPRPFYAWWGNKLVVQDLNLTEKQRVEIRTTIRDYRNHLADLRAQIDQSERDLASEFDRDPVDPHKANEAIERLAAARGELTRTLSQMSLKLRAVLTQHQWQELQRRRPVKGE